ncbi:hypothetical protein [Streptomyces sp. MBT33]|uniref:hypothetical protein n=1 Tax=Streptomyces sp. MBT33 TaxID=1488363 RepID=UPI00190B9A96|nr:hypothetical protein [Streptomyces sp. MBT33]MBK3639505.1 hypothetical protein [Streptomyces sp. MBT33]
MEAVSAVDQALDGLYAAVHADREAHQARIMGELDTIAEDLTETLPPELRAAGLRIAYEITEGA